MGYGSGCINTGYVRQFRSAGLSDLQRRFRHWDRFRICELIHVDGAGLLAYVGGVGVLIPKGSLMWINGDLESTLKF